MNVKHKPLKWKLGALAALFLVVLLPAGLLLNFYLPNHRVVRIVSADVLPYSQDKRAERHVTGVYQIFTEDPETRRQHVYHNEDTGWSFPWYFKFNSADIQSAATSIAGDASKDENYALITSYGWRVNLFSMFPNVTAIRRVPKDYVAVPWFNIAFFAVAAFVIGWMALLVRRWRRSRIAPPSAVNRVPS